MAQDVFGNSRSVEFRPVFKSSLLDVWKYISEDSRYQADKLVQEIYAETGKIQLNPEGYAEFKPWATQKKWYRFRTFKNHYIIFKVTKLKLVFIRVEHSKRSPNYFSRLNRK